MSFEAPTVMIIMSLYFIKFLHKLPSFQLTHVKFDEKFEQALLVPFDAEFLSSTLSKSVV